MKVIVVSRHYDYYEESYTEILGVRESDAEADALIEKDKNSRNHELMSAEEWFSHKAAYNSSLDGLMRVETNSPKTGGWVRRYHRENMSKACRPIYDRLCELSGTNSFDKVYKKYVLDDEFIWLMHQFLIPTDLTREQFEEVSEYYCGFENPKDVTYRKQTFDTKE